jgi:hypothetical protein
MGILDSGFLILDFRFEAAAGISSHQESRITNPELIQLERS